MFRYFGGGIPRRGHASGSKDGHGPASNTVVRRGAEDEEGSMHDVEIIFWNP